MSIRDYTKTPIGRIEVSSNGAFEFFAKGKRIPPHHVRSWIMTNISIYVASRDGSVAASKLTNRIDTYGTIPDRSLGFSIVEFLLEECIDGMSCVFCDLIPTMDSIMYMLAPSNNKKLV
jgi:hypothetical protein